jgi:hypothetical protein
MVVIENIRDIFSLLHDGLISEWKGDKDLLTLKIKCKYLAELFDKSFECFYLSFFQIDCLYLSTWPNPFDLPVLIFVELIDIFKAKLEILSAEIREDLVVISCNQHDTTFDYCGGDLMIRCQSIKIFNQAKIEITIDEPDFVCKKYWKELNEK